MDNDSRIETANKLRAHLVDLGKPLLEKGVYHEPRGFYDIVELDPDGELSFGTGDTFQNGEPFPIRLTHMTAALALLDNDDPQEIADENLIQRVGMRLQFHNQFYMNPELLPLPLWGNKPVATSDAVSFGTSAWGFDVPFVLSARDTMKVHVQLNSPPDDAGVEAAVSMTGIGYLSGRPYFLSGREQLDAQTKEAFNPVFFRNDGQEPIIVSDMTCNVSNDLDDDDPSGDIRNMNVQVEQVGNGTNAKWFQGPENQATGELIPAVLLGQRSGRAVVHRFPGDGLIWNPGEGIQLEAQGLSGQPPNVTLLVGLLGYITIT
jgi:hypothetical protein